MTHSNTIRRLNIVSAVAFVDAFLLVPLIIAALSHDEGTVSVLGPIHGTVFLVLLALCAEGARSERWGWWFPALVVVTLGPPGSLIGDIRIRRGLRAQGR
jgi:hypothetical protein